MGSFTAPSGIRLAYDALGPDDDERVLVCHPGGPGMSAAYFGDLAGLAADRRVVRFDPRGAGASEPPADGHYELEAYVADLEALRAHLGVDQFDYLGHSHGGFVGLLYALTHPGRLSHLVLCCSAPRFSDGLRAEAAAVFAAHPGDPWFDEARAAQRDRQAAAYGSPEEAAALYAVEVRLWFADRTPIVEEFLREFARQHPDVEALQYFNERIAPAYDLTPRLGEIDVPTLVVNGAADFFGPQTTARELAAVPGSRVVILPGAGHFPFVDSRDAFRRELEAFLG